MTRSSLLVLSLLPACAAETFEPDHLPFWGGWTSAAPLRDGPASVTIDWTVQTARRPATRLIWRTTRTGDPAFPSCRIELWYAGALRLGCDDYTPPDDLPVDQAELTGCFDFDLQGALLARTGCADPEHERALEPAAVDIFAEDVRRIPYARVGADLLWVALPLRPGELVRRALRRCRSDEPACGAGRALPAWELDTGGDP